MLTPRMAISIQRVEMSSSSTITRLLGVRPLLSCIQCPNTEYAFCTASTATGAAHTPPHISSTPSDPDASLSVLNEAVRDITISNDPILGCMSSHCTCNSPIINTSSAQHATFERPMVNLLPFPSICFVDLRHTAFSTNTEHVSYQPMPCHNELFTGREVCLEKLRRYFVPRDKSRPRRSFLIYGMGGAGKTQIALKFVEENSERCVPTF
jgi:hypothetical protein